MEYSLSSRRGEVEAHTSSTSNVTYLPSCISNHWSIKLEKWCLILSLLLRYFYSLMNIKRRKINNYFSHFICLLLTSHVVFANYSHHHPQNDTTTSSAENVRRSRYAGASEATANQNGSSSMIMKPEFFTIPIGGVLHLFPRYGYLSLSMKVIARNTSHLNPGNNNAPPRNDSWIFLEPVNNVIETSTMKIEETTFTPTNEGEALPFHNLFHFDLCEDIRALMEAYFKNFSIEGLDKPWQAFAGGWTPTSIARNFGIDQQFVEGDFRYVLLKVLLVRGSGSVEPNANLTVSESFASNFLRFMPDNDLSTYEFFKLVGTHYIHSYIMGNALYQVFVYDPDGFQAVKRKLFFDGIKDETTAGSAEPIMESLFMWMKHVGRVIILNAENNVIETVRKALIMNHSSTSSTLIPNLLKLHDNATLVRELEIVLSSQPNGILGIDLKGIQFLFTDPIQRNGFEKALKHKMQLWEINFLY